ncbi:MAG: YhbY family RNA-binding protein [Pseudomonadota bacterium]
MHKLTSIEQQALRARAHALDPVVAISEKGLSPSVLKEIDRSLKAHELVKIRVFGEDRAERAAIMETICTQLEALPIQHIGKVLVVYRENPKSAKTPATPLKTATSKGLKKPATARKRATTGPKTTTPRGKT